jgi:hypothetical protein
MDLGMLKRHIKAKADPGKNVAIFATTDIGGEKEICRLTVPIRKVEVPTVKTPEQIKGREPKAPPEPFKPITFDKWSIVATSVLRGIPLDTPKMGKDGKLITFIAFPIPIISVHVRGNHWPEGMEIKISQSRAGINMTFPKWKANEEEEKSGTMGQALAHSTIAARFGKEVAEKIFEMLAGGSGLPD